jgi:prevent-host-death family protein
MFCRHPDNRLEGFVKTATTLSSREFQQDTSQAQLAAQDGPVFITSEGTAVCVLLSIEEYRRITGKGSDTPDLKGKNIAELLYMPGIADIELEIPKLDELPRPADFS